MQSFRPPAEAVRNELRLTPRRVLSFRRNEKKEWGAQLRGMCIKNRLGTIIYDHYRQLCSFFIIVIAFLLLRC